MIYVFDASFVGALVIPDEEYLQAGRMYGKIKNEDEKHAPHLFWYEIANLYRNLLRRRRFSEKEVMGFYPRLTEFNLIIDSETGVEYSKRLLSLCNDYNLSSYDAAYLELADRKSAALCTMDESLRLAAKKHGVTVLK